MKTESVYLLFSSAYDEVIKIYKSKPTQTQVRQDHAEFGEYDAKEIVSIGAVDENCWLEKWPIGKIIKSNLKYIKPSSLKP